MRLLLVSYRPLEGAGGAVARWRSLVRHLDREGWTVDVVSAPGGTATAEFDGSAAVRARAGRRARAMSALRRVSAPALAAVRLRSAALTPSTLWARRGSRLTTARLRRQRYDAVLATAPPIAAALAAGLADRHGVPLVVELRDLWAGNPAYDSGSRLLAAVERRVLAQSAAVVVVTPEAAADVRRRHPEVAERVHVVPNGFEPELLDRRPEPRPPRKPVEILHTGTLIAARPVTPLLRALARRPSGDFRLVLHGYLAPESAAEVAAAPPGVDVRVLPPSSWEDAVERIAAADACLVTQSRDAGDATAVAGKVYEYLALGRPVLCLSHGGATESLLRRLGAAGLAVDLDDDAAIDAALDRLAAGDVPAPVAAELLLPYSRAEQAKKLAELLRSVAQPSLVA